MAVPILLENIAVVGTQDAKGNGVSIPRAGGWQRIIWGVNAGALRLDTLHEVEVGTEDADDTGQPLLEEAGTCTWLLLLKRGAVEEKARPGLDVDAAGGEHELEESQARLGWAGAVAIVKLDMHPEVGGRSQAGEAWLVADVGCGAEPGLLVGAIFSEFSRCRICWSQSSPSSMKSS